MSRAVFTDVRRFTTIESTNGYLLELARAGGAEGVVAVADYQSAGRGRLGRRWVAPPGSSLLASVLLRPVLEPPSLPLCASALALAAADACSTHAGVDAALKWPNDLVSGGRKLAGVLAESDDSAPGGPAGSVALVVGIGLNIDWPGPPEASGTSLRARGAAHVDRESLLESLLDHLAPRYVSLQQPGGPRALVEELRTRCATLGQPVCVELGGGVLRGRAVGLTDEGRLVVRSAAGTQEVSVGDVVHLRPDGDERLG